MDKITAMDFRGFIVVLAALVVFAGGILNLVKGVKDMRKPSEDVAKWRRDTDDKLAKDNKRISSLEDGNKALCQGMLAMLNHEITGNSIDKLRKAQENMNDYLINR